MNYRDFIASKASAVDSLGLTHPFDFPEGMFPFQSDLASWGLRRGRAAIFADTGTGKTLIQCAMAREVTRRVGNVLILAPLAVAEQTVAEAARFGIDVRYAREFGGAPITITNYDIVDRFDPDDFACVIPDESSILKSFDGKTRSLLIRKFERTPYRFAFTATPAPNDFSELGNHSEFLGIASRTDMLSRFFVHDGGSTADWRLKGHAVNPFWRWVCSWGAMLKKPSDLGYSDGGFILPEKRMHERIVDVDHDSFASEGMLFAPTAQTLSAQRATRRATMGARVAEAVRIVAMAPDEPCVIWCELNSEADEVTAAIPGAIQVAGGDSREDKARRLLGFSHGEFPILVSKVSIAGFGMNWQHCARTIFMGASHSYEMTFQAVRRFWRFGQKRPVDVYVIRAENEGAIVSNYLRKEADAERLGCEMSQRLSSIIRGEIQSAHKEFTPYEPNGAAALPRWLCP